MMKLLSSLLTPIQPFMRVIPHSHQWRRLTAEDDYGNESSRHWGNYGGCAQVECVLCNEVRRMDYAQAEREDAEAAEKAAAFNLSPKGLLYWQNKSRKDRSQIMIYDGGTVCQLESGEVYNGHSLVLSTGRDGKWFGPQIIYRNGVSVPVPK